jgi:hypothetical protein
MFNRIVYSEEKLKYRGILRAAAVAVAVATAALAAPAAADAAIQPTSVTTELSGGGQVGLTVSVTAGVPVTDFAAVHGANAATATGRVTYTIFSDAACTRQVSGGSLKTITTPGVLPPSSPATLPPGVYYWRAMYSGDPNNHPSQSSCGPSGEVENVAKAATALSTVLSGANKVGTFISIPTGATTTDVAKLTGPDARAATGTVTYQVFTDPACSALAAPPMTVPVAGSSVPRSSSVLLPALGNYYWRAVYSGDISNAASASPCGSEVLNIREVPLFDTVHQQMSTKTSTTVRQSTTAGGELVVAFVQARGPVKGNQTSVVSGAGLKWHFLARSNARRGDAEIWWARAGGKLSGAKITAKAHFAGLPITLTVVAYKNALSIGNHVVKHSPSGPPTGTLTTTWAGSWVWAVGIDWAKGIARTPVAGQSIATEHLDATDTYWTQATGKVTFVKGTSVTIRCSAPTGDPYNMVLVEIR